MSPAFSRTALLPAACAAAGLLSLAACSGSRAPQSEKLATVRDLDSLHQVAQYNDSVESNVFFYEEAFASYREKFPGVDKPAFMAIARGKDQAFCLFRPDPARTCQDIGDKLTKLGLREPARDAYEAGLLSEGANEGSANVRLWSSLARLHADAGEWDAVRGYLGKVLELEPKNKWARKLKAEAAAAAKGNGG